MTKKFPSLAAAVLALAASASCLAGGGSLGVVPPSATFGSDVTGAFTDTWTFFLPSASIVGDSVTNVQLSYNSSQFGGIVGLTAYLDNVANSLALVSTIVTALPGGGFMTTEVLADSGLFGPGSHSLVVSGTGITGSSASYGGNITAIPVSAVPEPESVALMLAGLGIVGSIVRRRRSA
jgi:hypothetical protein